MTSFTQGGAFEGVRDMAMNNSGALLVALMVLSFFLILHVLGLLTLPVLGKEGMQGLMGANTGNPGAVNGLTDAVNPYAGSTMSLRNSDNDQGYFVNGNIEKVAGSNPRGLAGDPGTMARLQAYENLKHAGQTADLYSALGCSGSVPFDLEGEFNSLRGYQTAALKAGYASNGGKPWENANMNTYYNVNRPRTEAMVGSVASGDLVNALYA